MVRAFQPLHNCQLGGELQLSEDEVRRYGSSSVIKIELQTSGSESQVWKSQNSMDTNRLMVYSAMEMGVGREAMSVMSDIFNMPTPCQHKAWDNHVSDLYDAHKKVVDEQSQQARDKVFSHYCSDETDVAEIAVSFDGTWSKRGYTASRARL